MNKLLSTNTNIVSEAVVDMVRKQDEMKQKYELRMGYFSQNSEALPDYDEANILYKEYEEAECKANQFISQNIDIPIELQKYLERTIEARAEWHEYCKTHYRKPKENVEIEMSNLFS